MSQPWRNRIVGSGVKPAADFLANELNWRLHPKHQQDALAGVLSEVGWVQEVIENVRTGRVIDGHLRITLALRQGDETPVPYKQVDLSEEEEALILATLDPLAALATTDAAKLDELLREVQTGDAAVQQMLSELAESAGLYPDEKAAGDGGDDFDATPADGPTICRPGDLWQLGEHRLIVGDSTDPATVERLMQGGRAACLWTDPPYGVSYVGKTKDALTIRNDGAEDLGGLLFAFLSLAREILEPGAPFYLAAPPGPQGTTFRNALDTVGFRLHQVLVWVKDSMVLGHSDYHYQHEDILYGWVPGPGRSGRGDHEGSRWYGDNAQKTVFQVPRPKRSEEHPTMKPVELIEPMLRNSTRRAEVVFEPFCGSGSTLIACERIGRRCRAVELEPKYADVILRRYQAETGDEPVLLDRVGV